MEGYTEPEKVSVPDPRITRRQTTFYDKRNGLWRGNLDILAQIDKNDRDDAIAGNLGAFSHDQASQASEGIADQNRAPAPSLAEA